MATTTIYPDANGTTYDAWAQIGGTSKWQNMQDALDATTVRHTAGAGQSVQGFSFQNIPGADVISSFTFKGRGFDNTVTHALKYFLRYGGADYLSAQFSYLTASWSWVNKTDWTTLTPAQLDSMEAGIWRLAGGDVNSTDMSECNIEVTYIPASGGYTDLLAQWLPLILPVAGIALMRREIATILQRCKTRPSMREDFERIREALMRRPVWVGGLISGR